MVPVKKFRDTDTLSINTRVAKTICLSFAGGLILLGFLLDSPAGILEGLHRYITSRAVLITDYFALASMGAAFVNAGIVMLMAIGLTLIYKCEYNGSLVAALFLMPGFALFGKNPVNILPFFLGVRLYAAFQKESMCKYILGAFYSTTLAPIVSDLMLGLVMPWWASTLIAFGAGTVIGFIIVPLAKHLFQFHHGYNLFNYGFACGLIAYIFTAIARARHLTVVTEMHWQAGVAPAPLLFILSSCTVFILLGLYFSGWKLKTYLRIFRYHGHATSDQITSHGIGVTLINMGTVGLLCLGYILLIGGDLSGPIVGGIFTAIGFAAIGTHPLNLAPIMLGVWFASAPDITAHATNPAVQMAVIFGATALAPMAGEYGPFVGIIAGMLHFALVYTSASSTGGFNLYNNGFSAGIVAMVLVTLIHVFLPRFDIVTQRKMMRVLLMQIDRKSVV